MRSALAPQIGQKERATLAGVHLDAWTAPAGALVPCPVCALIFKKKRLKHYFNTSQCRFRFWDRQRMDFRVLNRKLDIIIERLPEKAAGIKEGS